MSDQNIIPIVEQPCGGSEISWAENEWLERSDHPLLNDLIMNSVFQHLGKNELKVCRFVCKRWNILTIPFTRKIFRVTIYGDESNSTKLHTIQNFVDVFRSNELGIPFERFELGLFCTTNGVGQEFLQLFGGTTKEVRYLRQASQDYIIEDVSELLKSTPTLESFQIPTSLRSRSGNVIKLFPDCLKNSKSKLASLKMLTTSADNSKKRNECCPTFLEELITPAQNILCLDMSGSDSRIGLDVLSLIEKLGRETSIEELTISVGESDHNDYSDLLLRMTMKPNGLRLKWFYYSAPCTLEDSLALQLIPHFRDTLEYLHIYLYKTHCPDFIEFPKMSRLTRLYLAWFSNDFKFKCDNLNEIFPALREVTLWKNGSFRSPDQVNDEFFPDSVPCPNINALELNNTPAELTINGFNQMLTVFTNLTKFKMNIKEDAGAEILRRIWSQMIQLESLDISGITDAKDSLDSVFTGIPIHALQEVRDKIDNMDKIPFELERREMISSLRNQYSTLPSIGNLINLSSLTMNVRGSGGGVDPRQWMYLTDLSGYLGFYSLKRLKHLYVAGCEMTQTCCEILRNEMGLETWRFSNKEFLSIIPHHQIFDSLI